MKLNETKQRRLQECLMAKYTIATFLLLPKSQQGSNRSLLNALKISDVQKSKIGNKNTGFVVSIFFSPGGGNVFHIALY